MIEVAFTLDRGGFKLETRIAAAGPVLALVGPSGSGKTTTLNVIAGFERPGRGRIAIGEMVLFDSSAQIEEPPQRRRLGYVFQEPRLFPHMSVAANLRYGARNADARQANFEAVVARLGIAALLDRRPRDLSGGEKQRVAIGRALLANPRALLLDEPLSAIDVAKGGQILDMVEELRDAFAIPIIFVSHRPLEVARLANDIAEYGAQQTVVARPAGPAI